MKKCNIWYWKNGAHILNLGEQLAPKIVNHFGVECKEISKSQKHYDHEAWGDRCIFLIGSELVGHRFSKKTVYEEASCNNLHVWGMGAGSDLNLKNRVPSNVYKKIKIHAVRGPISQRIIRLGSDLPMGDPAFLMPEILPIDKNPSDNITYVPHHSTLSSVNRDVDDILNDIGANKYINIIFNKSHFQNVLEKLLSSKFVLTSTLHTAILCISYGVPWAPIQLSGEVVGGKHHPLKWLDVMKWLNVPDEEFYFVKNYKEGIAWWDTVGSKIKIPDLEPLVKSFPF